MVRKRLKTEIPIHQRLLDELGFLLFEDYIFCRVLDIRVPEVVDSDTLDPCRLRPSVHLMVEIAFRDGENALLLLDAVEHPQVVLHLVTEEVGHFNGAVAYGLEIPSSLATSSAFTNSSLLMRFTSLFLFRKYVNVSILIIH